MKRSRRCAWLAFLVCACSGSSGPGAAQDAVVSSLDAAPTFGAGGAPSDSGGPAPRDTPRGPVRVPDFGLPPAAAPDRGCQPDCGIRRCGDDGCGGSCGSCGEGQRCSPVGRCEVDPTLGCEGLDLAVDWVGEFEGDIIFTAIGVIPIDASTHGTMEFTIKCLNSKLVVKGQMDGEASDNPFTLTMDGFYDPATRQLEAELKDGDVVVYYGLLRYFFEGPIEGTLAPDDRFEGTWEVQSTNAIILGGIFDPSTLTLSGTGTWSAWPKTP